MKKFYFFIIALCVFSASEAQVITFPDANFKTLLLTASGGNNIAKNFSGDYFKIDSNNDSEISISEALQVKELNFYTIALSLPQSQKIYSLEGVRNFQNIELLYCQNHNLTGLDVHNMNSLKTLHVNNNFITSVNLSGAVNLTNVNLHYNQLSNLDLSSNINITGIGCGYNLLEELDVNNLKSLQSLYCMNNQLARLFLKNGRQEVNLDFSGNPNLQFVCCDESQSTQILNLINSYSYLNCNMNSYCSFIPGGIFYTIQSNAKYDINSNGCDTFDTSMSDLKYTISSGAATGTLISNNASGFSIPVQTGTHIVTPIFENPPYFNVSPPSFSVSFPSQASPFIQNFCVSPNGVHSDLEIVLLPINPARPGFVSNYALTYKNKGNQIQSGTVSLNFEDAKMNLVAVSPAPTSQITDALNWNYSNLQPLENRVIYFSMEINAPTDSPAVNNGDYLNFAATITPMAGDEVPYDNTSAIKQLVVGSYDPNDKTCLEGTTIAPSEVGKYVHYVIRFENTGTYPAENIVVKDMIDTAKFDVSTLVPIKGSHDFFTRIDGNKVEFIFENINLPFDDANNDGYVAFKIKTKPTLVNGDTFSNSASIYFDYNFPIVTNTATTTIQALSTQDYEFTDYFNVYPNPVNTVLNVDTKQTIEVSSISIYNQLGQLVLVIPNAQNTKTVDVSRLASGNYFIKINSDKGTSKAKFIKR